ncbi:MAG: hypothetical protein Q8Q50_03540 [Methylobacter sp.]|nr:hypothetical protein [Methylobacter sp.]
MDFIKELYNGGLSLYEMLDVNVIYDEAGKRVDDYIPSSIFDKNQIEMIGEALDLHNNCSKLKNSSDYYSRNRIYQESDFIFETPQEIEAGIREGEMCKLLIRGKNAHFVAFGYSDIDNPYPTVIPMYEWKFLKVSIARNAVYNEDREYKDVKFVLSTKLKNTPAAEFNKLTLLVNNKATLIVDKNSQVGIEYNLEKINSFNKILEVMPEQIESKLQKKLIPIQRETNTALLLLYDIFKHYKVVYLNELSGVDAWGRIVSSEFSSEYIKAVSATRKAITLSDGAPLERSDFLEKYRKRFKL